MRHADTESSNGGVTRRALLGATGGALLGLSLHQAFTRVSAAPAARPAGATADHVILFWCGGGLSHVDTWDPKPGRPTQGAFEAIQTSAAGVRISEVLPTLARQMHHAALIRSLVGEHADHGRAGYHLQTGCDPGEDGDQPAIGSLIAHQRGSVGDAPAFVSIGGRAQRDGCADRAYAAHDIGSTGQLAERLAITRPGAAVDEFDLRRRAGVPRARYGDNAFGRAALLTRQLVERGVRVVQVNCSGFDHHADIFGALTAQGAAMDRALASLVEDLHTGGMLGRTLVVVLSEFGRTPRINNNAGRDHWSGVFSCLIAGGGVRGGAVVGSSDRDGYEPRDRPVTVADLHATIRYAMGVESDKHASALHGPASLSSNGRPVMELFG